MADTIEIARRFCGPPRSGNGGYVAGRLAEHLVEDPDRHEGVAVRLLAPPPLETPLSVREEADGAAVLADGDRPVARARRAPLALEAPAPPSFEAASEAARRFRGFEAHVFPGCFVCGDARPAGDGLRIFPGALEPARGFDSPFAAPWIPDASLVDPGEDEASSDDGVRAPVVPSAFLWAALDCPGAFAFPQPEGRILLLGELQVRLDGVVRVGERCVLTSGYEGRDGRKHTTRSAIHGEDGGLRGVARGTWIELPPDAVPRA